jgi:serine/threonine protein kinase, bacterial
MSDPLGRIEQITEPPGDFLRRIGRVFAEFGEKTQDSGNVSYGVEIAGERHFVKTAGDPADTRWVLPHAQRIALLGNAVDLRRSCDHPALPILHHVIGSPHGPMLIYEWLEGELLSRKSLARDGARQAIERFMSLEDGRILSALDTVYELHERLADAGWVAEDFYDSCLIYDFSNHRIRVFDLDTYHRGPFINETGRLFGSTRFMAPEEFQRGARIDQRTTVYNLGRLAVLFLSPAGLETGKLRAPAELSEVVRQACQSDPSKRFASVRAFAEAWHNAR